MKAHEEINYDSSEESDLTLCKERWGVMQCGLGMMEHAKNLESVGICYFWVFKKLLKH